MNRARRFLLTRPADQCAALADALRRAGVEPVIVPAIAIRPPRSYAALDRVLVELHRYDWVLFTSANAVRALHDRLVAASVLGTIPTTVAWAAVGPSTAGALAALGISAVWTPPDALGLRAAADLPAAGGARVLWVRGDRASAPLAQRLRERGLIVDDVVAYRTVEAPNESTVLLAAAWRDGLDGVVLASASAARGFATLARAAGIGSPAPGFVVVAIGPVTAGAAREAGWPAQLVARQHTNAGIVHIIAERSRRGAASV
ncbi:MAG TPA: uroporphyrinogen-III synthase [bacterium]|jgi:uroporphyrinogen-III synthase|nr:uroporphyrinogen-III synthase [bacterium]